MFVIPKGVLDRIPESKTEIKESILGIAEVTNFFYGKLDEAGFKFKVASRAQRDASVKNAPKGSSRVQRHSSYITPSELDMIFNPQIENFMRVFLQASKDKEVLCRILELTNDTPSIPPCIKEKSSCITLYLNTINSFRHTLFNCLANIPATSGESEQCTKH